MKKIIKHSIFIKLISVLIVLSISILSSCGDSRYAEDILFNITKNFPELPDGTVYISSSEEENKNSLIPDMINSLYHEGAAEYEFSLIEEYAVYISDFAKPCEIAVYKCFSRSDTNLIASMCLSRIEKLSVMLKGTSFSEIPLRANVDIRGNFVIVTMV